MSGEILEDVLTKLKWCFIKSNRNIHLLRDNAGCHPKELVSQFSNIKIVFFPSNTTSTLQLLDLGIIQNFTMYHHKHVLSYVVSKIDECNLATDVVKLVTILVALRWVVLVWNEVTPQTHHHYKCFREAGILNDALDVVGLDSVDGSVDPFSAVDGVLD